MSKKTVVASNHECRIIFSEGSGIPLVFLHGYSFDSDVWRRVGVNNVLEDKKIPFLMLDMPYGAKSDCKPKTRNVEANVAVVREAIIETLGSLAPVIVGASLGAHMALQYAARYPVKGILLISPVNAFDEKLLENYDKFSFPVLIIYGSKDNIVSEDEMRKLADRLPNSRLQVYEGAGHAAYLNRPDLFKRELLEFHANVEKS